MWCADSTYIPVRGGFFYLVAVMDWASRFVLSWELDNTMEVGFCVSAMEEAWRRHDAPAISNTDQGSQFTSEAFVRPLLDAGLGSAQTGPEMAGSLLSAIVIFHDAGGTGSPVRVVAKRRRRVAPRHPPRPKPKGRGFLRRRPGYIPAGRFGGFPLLTVLVRRSLIV